MTHYKLNLKTTNTSKYTHYTVHIQFFQLTAKNTNFRRVDVFILKKKVLVGKTVINITLSAKKKSKCCVGKTRFTERRKSTKTKKKKKSEAGSSKFSIHTESSVFSMRGKSIALKNGSSNLRI